ncbi:MAG: hypothetical protein LBT50_05805 [Prevotellaceae bacterium]|nr:hypothetical protein [Prevotellaceae bacterium]
MNNEQRIAKPRYSLFEYTRIASSPTRAASSPTRVASSPTRVAFLPARAAFLPARIAFRIASRRLASLGRILYRSPSFAFR